MIERTTNPEKFANCFNSVVPGAYRKITTQDIRDMTECGLIRCYGGYYSRVDLERVRGILQYEQMREKRSAKSPDNNKQEQPTCKMCGEPLPPKPADKAGRPKEYCSKCELLRVAERCRKWRKQRRAKQKTETGIGVVYT